MRCFPLVALTLALAAGSQAIPALAADDVSLQIESARQAYAKGDPLHSLSALQAATNTLNAKLSDQFGHMMPPPPTGWDAAAPESQSLDTVGGGLTVTRAYTHGNATLNASLIADNPAVGSTITLFQNANQIALQPGWSRVHIGADDAMLRYDNSVHAGEIMMVVGDRILLQIEGTDIASADVLVDAAKGWNVPAVRKLLNGGA